MADISPTSCACVAEGETVTEFDDVFSVKMAPSTQESLQYSERFVSPRDLSLPDTDGVLHSRSPTKREINTDPELSSMILNRKTQRVVSNLQWTSSKFIPNRLRIVFSATYVSACVEDLTLYAQVIATDPDKDTFRFSIRYFECLVQTEDGKTNIRTGFVGTYEEEGILFDISSNIAEPTSNVILKPHEEFNLESPDERFFLMYKGSGEYKFESLPYENMFMKLNYESTRIIMEDQSSFIEIFPSGSQSITIETFSGKERIFSFEPIEKDEKEDTDDENDV